MSGTPIQQAKLRLPLPLLIQQLGLGDHAKKSAKCPSHEDRHNSFSVWQTPSGFWHWKCHAGCGQGDEIDFLALYKNISKSEAIKLFLEMAGVVWQRKSNNGQNTPFDWQRCVSALKPKDLVRLGNERWLSRSFCSWLHKEKLIGLYNGCITFPVTENGRVVGMHCRGNDGWWYAPTGTRTQPFAIGELVAGEVVHVFESQWDAFAFMDKSGEYNGIVITRGAGNGVFVSDLIPVNSTAYVWTQNDQAAEKWQKDICANTKATVKRAKIPAHYKDLNDWTRAGATADDLLATIMNAEVIRQAEKSWADALNDSVVTSSELRQLRLKPRRNLLGDWFSEGDLGFIFAFRGVGKTWLALAIAQALSAGGELGDWKAHEPVSVLYIDGEMPPDLMSGRCDGLQATNENLHLLNHEILFERAGRVLNIANREVQEAISTHCITSGVKVLILDNLSTLATGMKENEADSWELVNNWLLHLRRQKIAVVIVHHAGRSGEMRGTSKREDNVFWIIALDDAKKNAEDKRGARFISRFTKPSRNTQEEVPAYEWHFVTDNASGEVSISHKLAQTMDVFLGLIEDGVTECSEIAEEMKTSKATVSRMAKQAMKSKKIIKVGREYFLAEGAKNDPKP